MTPERPPITDSPWFWAYLFSLAALLSLALIGPKYGRRQAQIEQQFQGRQAVAATRAGEPASSQPHKRPSSLRGEMLVTLRPLWLGLAVATTVAWIAFWRNRSPGAGVSDSAASSPSSGTDT